MSNEVETFTKNLAGREITFRRPILAQILILERLYQRAQRRAKDMSDTEDRVGAMSSAMVQVLDFIDSLMTNDDDRQFVEEQMLAGNIDHTELIGVLGGPPEDSQDDQPPVTKRAASRKVAKKATSARAKR